MSDEENFVELFAVNGFTGNPEDLVSEIEALAGVEKTTASNYRMVSDGKVNVEIEYDPIETDRTQLTLWIEDFDSVAGEVTGA